MTVKPLNIIIKGLNVNSYLCALQLKQQLKIPVNITLVGQHSASTNIQTSLCYQQVAFLQKHYDQALVEKLSPCLTVGYQYTGWSNSDFFTPNASELDFFHRGSLLEMSKLRREGNHIDLTPESLFFSATLASQSLYPICDKFPFITEFDSHFDSQLLLTWLTSELKNNHIHIEENAVDDAIKQADYLINFSDESKSENINYQPLKLLRHHDKALSVKVETDLAINTINTIALTHGFVTATPCHGGLVLTYYFSSQCCTLTQAKDDLTAYIKTLNAEQVTEINTENISPKINKAFWQNGQIDFSTASFKIPSVGHNQNFMHFHIIDKVCELLNAQAASTDNINNINHAINFAYQEAFALINALLLFNSKKGNDYWNTPQDQSFTPQVILPLIQQWFSEQDLIVDKRKIFSIYDDITWYCLFTGLELLPPSSKEHPEISTIKQTQADIKTLLQGCAQNFTPLASAKEIK